MAAKNCAAMESFVDSQISDKCLVVFSKTTCSWCYKLKANLDAAKIPHKVIELDKMNLSNANFSCAVEALENRSGVTTVPQVFLEGKFIGGGSDNIKRVRSGELGENTQACIARFAAKYREMRKTSSSH